MKVETYLHTSFENLHSKTQAAVGVFFAELRPGLSVYPAFSVRLKLRERLYLVPDVAVFQLTEPQQPVPETPPLIAIEVLSLDDKLTKLRQKLEDYRVWGVPHIWLVDPHAKRLYTCDAGLVEVATLKIPELGVEVTPADLFD